MSGKLLGAEPGVWYWLGLASLIAITYLIVQRQRQRRSPKSLDDFKRHDSDKDTAAIKDDGSRTSSESQLIFPPSQRHTLARIISTLPDKQRELLECTLHDPVDLRTGLIALDQDYQKCDANKVLPNGLRIQEIQAISDFPDFDLLTGYPHPQPYHDFNIDKALPRPYRPYRFPYHQTMSLSKLEPDWWIELESTYRSRIKQRKSLFEQDAKSVLAYLPGSELACRELMQMVLQYVTYRYPHYFSLTGTNSRYGNRSRRTVFHNKILGTSADVNSIHPLHILLEHIPEDFVLMLRDPATGQYQFRAGVICSSLGWNLGSVFGLPLADIHQHVPHYATKMRFSMDRFFSKLACDKPIQRGSWGFEVDEPLYMAPGDPLENVFKTKQAPELDASRIHLRVDRQTLRRLPLSSGIVFNFKALFTPLTDLKEEPYIPSLCLKVLKEGNEDILNYKNTWHTEHVVLPAFEMYEKEQIEKGLIEKNWEVRTLDEAPFYPGWEERWRTRQGF